MGLVAIPLRAGLAGESGRVEGSAGSEQVAFFEREVRPILEARCFKCHAGGSKVKGNLRLDSRSAILEGGDQGPAVSLEKPEESLLLRAILYEDLEMPPAGKLPERERSILVRWVREGLPWAAAPAVKPVASEKPRSPHAGGQPAWLARSTKPVQRPAVPAAMAGTAANPIDAFISDRLAREGLSPSPPASKLTLIRRAAFDLTGLPPTPEEVDAFLADQSPDAYERLIDRLLASPHHGEKWARHWLDLVGYAETNGYERDNPKPFAWRYRDYVIDACNRDKPFDQFIREQLAGDLIDPRSAECLTATGYYRLGLWDDEPADRELARYDGLDTIVATTGQAILGMTINCARCHDHKVDPIPQRDYYRLLAFFQDLKPPDERNLRAVVDATGRTIEVMCASDAGHRETYVLLRGNPGLKGAKVEPGIPALLDARALRFAEGASKRRELADWLMDPRNPRTSRVLANRIWQYLFGRGIVPSSSDFGGLGEAPSHPELLDWLAAEIVAQGWRRKPILRLIMLSNAYQRSSQAYERALRQDPRNRWVWRYPMRRLAAEEIRDAILAVAGELNPALNGPSVCPPISAEVLAGQSVPGKGWEVSPPRLAARRSIYVHIKRSLALPILEAHDQPEADAGCPARFTTTAPTQALGLLNSDFTNQQAAWFARRLEAACGGDRDRQIELAVRLAYARRPRPDEAARDCQLLDWLERVQKFGRHEALSQYALLLLNANEFVYLD